MKTKKIATVIMIFVFIICLLIWTIPSLTNGQTTSAGFVINEETSEFIKSGTIYNQALAVGEPRILPGSILYPVKNFIWALRYHFISNPAKQLQWDLDAVSEKLLELQKLSVISPTKNSALDKSLANYQAAMIRLQSHLTNFSNNQTATDLNVFLDNLAQASLEYEKIFSDVYSRNISDDFKNRVNEMVGQGVALLDLAGQKLESKESALTGFSAAALKNDGSLLSYFRSLETVLIVENALANLSKTGTLDLKEKLFLQVQAELKNFKQSEKIKLEDVVAGLPGNKLVQGRIIRELEEVSGQSEFFGAIEEKLKQLPVSAGDWGKCQAEISSLESKITAFKNKLAAAKLSENIKSLLEQSEGHLQRAKEIASDETQAGNFCGLVNSSGVLLENAQRILEKSQPEEIDAQIKSAEEKLSALVKRVEQLNQDDYARVFDLFSAAELELESIKANWQDNNAVQVLRQLNNFEIIVKNTEKSLDLIDGKLDKSAAKALGLEKELLKKGSLEEFSKWCQTKLGSLIDDLSILPRCVIDNGSSFSMSDWLAAAK